MDVHMRLLRTVPGYREARDLSENHALRSAYSPFAGRTGCTKIPVVVHVVYNTPAQNISDAQIKSQIAVLTADFRKKNADVSTVPLPFAPLAADSRIEFELASKDPAGNPTTGITRTQTGSADFTDDDAVKSAASGGADAWPADKYLNIWVCQLADDLLGYAQFPGGPAATDGVVILHSAFGTTGTAAAPFNLGRTTTHEVGHWLNLRHIWGDDGTGCAGSDFVADTPNQGGPNLGVPTFPRVSCGNAPNGDLFMDYMDYVDDAAMVMFTKGQVVRMQATLDGFRSSIGTAIPCGKPLPKDLPKELPKDLPKDPPKDLPKEFPKDLPKDPPKDLPKEFPKDLPKDLPKDPPKEFPKEFPKELPKDFPKDFPKELPKDFPKDIIKEFPKDPPKELPKDPPKEFPKDIIKEFPKDAPFDLPFSADPSKDRPPGPAGSWSGGMPFVLATPAGAPVGQGGPAPTLASTYQELLGQFARLYASGQLDAAGIVAYQQIALAYQYLTSAPPQKP
jgi:hypothetical protein